MIKLKPLFLNKSFNLYELLPGPTYIFIRLQKLFLIYIPFTKANLNCNSFKNSCFWSGFIELFISCSIFFGLDKDVFTLFLDYFGFWFGSIIGIWLLLPVKDMSSKLMLLLLCTKTILVGKLIFKGICYYPFLMRAYL